jgi:hypothetical protein
MPNVAKKNAVKLEQKDFQMLLQAVRGVALLEPGDPIGESEIQEIRNTLKKVDLVWAARFLKHVV